MGFGMPLRMPPLGTQMRKLSSSQTCAGIEQFVIIGVPSKSDAGCLLSKNQTIQSTVVALVPDQALMLSQNDIQLS